jgi:hypothetical protein
VLLGATVIDLTNPTFNPLSSFTALAQAEQAQRTAKDAQKASYEALKKQIIAPLIPALTAVFDHGIKIIGDYHRATTPTWKEDHHGVWSCSYKGVTGTNTLFSVKADLIGGNQLDDPPIPVIVVMGRESISYGAPDRPKLGQFRDWHSAYQCCIEALTKRLHQETLDRLSKAE